ncbi:MAG TPA: hypothetical protein VMJ32_08010 [Pirellulales bacterium]|nr:hypothetical protein [Pirellulales bacterium]
MPVKNRVKPAAEYLKTVEPRKGHFMLAYGLGIRSLPSPRPLVTIEL